MENAMINNVNESSMDYQGAMALHAQIMASASVAATALIDMCMNLKKMRDTRQYIHLGYENFEAYVETAVGIKSRQAYTYISTVERLGESVLQSNASLGITKLSLLAGLPESARTEVFESGEAEDLSVKELKELTEKLTAAQDQISFLEDQIERKTEQQGDKEQTVAELAAEKEALKEKISLLESEKSEISKRVEKEVAEKVKLAKQKAEEAAAKSLESKIEAAKKDGMEAGKNAVKKGLEAVEREKAEAIERAAELEKRLAAESNKDSIIFAHLFSEFQQGYNQLAECANKIVETDPDTGKKYWGAIKKLVTEVFPSLLPEE